MVTFNSLVLLVMIWWVVLFAVLPWGVRTLDPGSNPARWRGAPERPLMWRKLLATTAIALLLWAVAQYGIRAGWVSLRPPASVLGD